MFKRLFILLQRTDSFFFRLKLAKNRRFDFRRFITTNKIKLSIFCPPSSDLSWAKYPDYMLQFCFYALRKIIILDVNWGQFIAY